MVHPKIFILLNTVHERFRGYYHDVECYTAFILSNPIIITRMGSSIFFLLVNSFHSECTATPVAVSAAVGIGIAWYCGQERTGGYNVHGP